jgi:hypothetical protein
VVTCLVSRAWQDSFACICTNKNTIAEQGWTPLNYNCLLHPEIAATRWQGSEEREEHGNRCDDNNLNIDDIQQQCHSCFISHQIC